MKNIFNTVKMSAPDSNRFDLTHDVKMSGKMGNLMPSLVMDVLPGDKISIGSDAFIRFAPMLAPIMHRVDVSFHYFFVPNRILWDRWEDFITGKPDTDGLPISPPYFTQSADLDGVAQKFLDYFGIPPFPNTGTQTNATVINALPLAAYQKIYNDYYRDQNLIPEVNWKLSSTTANNTTNADLFIMRRRAYEHDYFTASLPFAQKGAVVDIPLGDVVLKDDWATVGNPMMVNALGNPPIIGVSGVSQVGSSSGTPRMYLENDDATDPVAYDPKGTLVTSPTSINDLRRAFRLQEFLERIARGGSRYFEQILAHFGIKSPDSRLQMPEYITGVKSPVVISEVLNTTGTENAPQGDMSGHGVSVATGGNKSYFVQEHGWIIGICSIMPRTAYQQGLPKMFVRPDYLDYAFPSFAHLGEQEVKNQEVFAYTSQKNGTFGYVPRYAEYKFIPSRVAGDFRDSLAFWHLGRIFTAPPALNQDFIECDPADVLRIFSVQDATDNIWMHVVNNVQAVRKLPKFGTPTI